MYDVLRGRPPAPPPPTRLRHARAGVVERRPRRLLKLVERRLRELLELLERRLGELLELLERRLGELLELLERRLGELLELVEWNGDCGGCWSWWSGDCGSCWSWWSGDCWSWWSGDCWSWWSGDCWSWWSWVLILRGRPPAPPLTPAAGSFDLNIRGRPSGPPLDACGWLLPAAGCFFVCCLSAVTLLILYYDFGVPIRETFDVPPMLALRDVNILLAN
jgi:hypothetical protein